jgi:TetR/AcrR family transcriptional repressor of nem operon
MVGKKAFDPRQVMEKAMNAFWQRGYEGLSVEDLVQCTGIGRGSLYDTFGDKHSLYLAALDCYLAAARAQSAALLDQAGTLREVLEHFFQTYIDALLSDPARRGCFLVNASLEMAPHDPEVAQKVAAGYADIEEAFYAILARVRTTGELDSACDPRQLARFLLATLVSIRVLARTNAGRQTLQDIVRTALSVLH